ncbi:MAG: hypothetical protein LBU65_11445 [Planctomycetaceae bacterium]|jgi:hypothetical protein|nr:hypothetical protein [Planctomycetaceae bacterium]
MKSFFVLFSFVFVLTCLVGCGKSTGVKTEYVSGVITLDGNPVQKGTKVRFIPVTEGKGEPAGGFTDEKGVYTLSSVNGDPEKGALEGEYKIVVSRAETTFFEENDPKAPKNDLGERVTSVSKEVMPKIYTDVKTTPLTYTVVKGKQTHDIEVSSK